MSSYNNTYRSPSFFDNFTLNPVPYPVLIILVVISLLLGLQWYSSLESVVESAEEGLGWALFVVPVVLLFLVKWLSSFEGSSGHWLFGTSAYDRRLRESYWQLTSEGGSPWGVLALILVLLVLVWFQGSFLDGWFF